MTDNLDRYVVSKFPNAGFGDHLSCLFGAWWYARNTNRTLVIDWRGSRFNPTPGKNCFFSFFKEVTVLGGVRVIADNSVDQLDLPGPIYPDKWTAENIQTVQHVPHSAGEVHDIKVLVAQTLDRPEPTIVINQHVHELPHKEAMRALLDGLQFCDAIKQAADAFCAKHWQTETAVGVHIRHGNGENIGERASYWLDPLALVRQLRLNQQFDLHQRHAGTLAKGQFYDNAAPSLTATSRISFTEAQLYRKVAAQIEILRQQPDLQDATVFLCTDAKRVEEGLARHTKDLSTYPKLMLDEGGGPLHQIAPQEDGEPKTFGPVESDIVTEMLVELELLRRTSALICIPSQFSVISRIELPTERQFFLKPPIQNRLIARLLRG